MQTYVAPIVCAGLGVLAVELWWFRKGKAKRKVKADLKVFINETESNFLDYLTLVSSCNASRCFADNEDLATGLLCKHKELWNRAIEVSEPNPDITLKFTKNLQLISELEKIRNSLPYYSFTKDEVSALEDQKEGIMTTATQSIDDYLIGYYNGIEEVLAQLENRVPQLITVNKVERGR
jgi:hypothetical protein